MYRLKGPLIRGCLTAALALTAAFLAAPAPPARAQEVAALVNGEPITALDVAQRRRLMQISTRKTPSPKEALDELIDEKLKLQTARRYKLDITETDVDSTFANMARRARQSPADFARALTSAGINVDAFKMRVKADIAWQQIVRGKFRGQFHIRERDVFAALQSRNKDDETVGYEYTLRPILFIVPRGSPESVVAARRREAEGLRTRFENCEQGLRLARGLVDIAIRDQIVRTSDDFSAQLRELLERTPVGRLTPPEQTTQGIEFYAVCAKERTSGATPGKREVQDEMMKERFDAQGERYLKELRRSAMIEYR